VPIGPRGCTRVLRGNTHRSCRVRGCRWLTACAVHCRTRP
jgi:hypothetical protein